MRQYYLAAFLFIVIVLSSNGFAYGNSATPTVFYTSTPVFQNETVLATTGNTDSGAAVRIAQLPDSDPGSPLSSPTALPSLTPTTVVQASSTAVKFLVPASFSAGVYDFRIENSKGVWSNDTLLNTPVIYFIQGDLGNTATPGGWLEVHGLAIGMPGKTPSMALVANGSVVRTLTPVSSDKNNDLYRQRFSVPKSMPAGNYTVYVHNGSGGPNGWVQFNTFVTAPVNTVTIAAAPVWPQTAVTVAAPTGSNDDDKITSALAVVANGGIVTIPAGKYTLTRAIVLPNHVVLQGEGQSITLLNWVSDPMHGTVYLPLISGASLGTSGTKATFTVKNLGIAATSTYNGNAIERTYTSETGTISNVSINLPLITSTSGANATGIWLRNTSNTIITNNLINARLAIFAREGVTNLRIEQNHLQWRDSTINLSGNSYNFIITDNKFELMGNSLTNAWAQNDNPGFCYRTAYGFPYFSGAYLENLYYANNTSIHDAVLSTSADYAVGLTFDAAAGIYFGAVNKVETIGGVTTVTLNSPTKVVTASDGSSVPYQYAGAVMKVESGTGMGQWVYITDAQPNSTLVTINQPFSVPLDSTSKVSIVNMLGRAIFDSNVFGSEPTNQSYYFSMDVIKANNAYQSAVTQKTPYYDFMGGDLVWAGQHYNMPFTDWHFQFLNNQLTQGNTTFATMTTSPAMPGLQGPAAADLVYRNNSIKGAAIAAVLLRSGGGNICDAVIEGNTIQYIGLGRTNDPLNFTGIVLRHNTGASYNYGNLAGKNPGSIPGVAYLP